MQICFIIFFMHGFFLFNSLAFVLEVMVVGGALG